MTVADKPETRRTIWEAEPGQPVTFDQTLLPFACQEISLNNVETCATAIRTMQVRGAPLIGAVAAWGMALALREDASDTGLAQAYDKLIDTRPTAVNLRWALDRVLHEIRPRKESTRAAAAIELARKICDDDVACNRQIGAYAMATLNQLPDRNRAAPNQKPQYLTHCNAGRIATVGYGTALAPFYLMHEAGDSFHVWVGETRPRNQGASLTAWELGQAGISHTIIADNAGGLLMMRGEVDAVIVGCDRVVANGDVINKIGTYLKALAAAAHDVPFYVACPTSTIDLQCASGSHVTIENRDPDEVTHIQGVLLDGNISRMRITPHGSPAANPAFDITPASLITKLITERGIVDASEDGIRSLGIERQD
ncbi:MAG: S-methyl-5-thioribose-1-phosphate isomerase [Burkholderiaceae bacterium]